LSQLVHTYKMSDIAVTVKASNGDKQEDKSTHNSLVCGYDATAWELKKKKTNNTNLRFRGISIATEIIFNGFFVVFCF